MVDPGRPRRDFGSNVVRDCDYYNGLLAMALDTLLSHGYQDFERGGDQPDTTLLFETREDGSQFQGTRSDHQPASPNIRFCKKCMPKDLLLLFLNPDCLNYMPIRSISQTRSNSSLQCLSKVH